MCKNFSQYTIKCHWDELNKIQITERCSTLLDWTSQNCDIASKDLQVQVNPTENSASILQILELTPRKDVLFIIEDWNTKVESQEIPGVIGKFGLGVQNEAGQTLIEFCQESTLVIANTLFQQHKRRLYTWTSPDGQHWNQMDYILCSQRWRSSTQSGKTKPGADCGSGHELLIAKFRLKLKKVGKTTRPFRYDPIKSLTIIQWKWQIDSRD